MKKGNILAEANDSFELTSMIDVVFLLLIYFMYLPIQQEADLMFTLPVVTPPAGNVKLPNELTVEIMPDGSVFLNGTPMDPPGTVVMMELASTLKRLKDSSDRNGISTIVSIYPDADSAHQFSMSVLDACALAGIKQVSFAEAD